MSANRAERMIRNFEALERALVASRKGFHETSPWWRETIARFYRSGRKQLVVRKGRRAGGSVTLARIAVLEALYGGHKVPAGDTGYVVFVSVSRTEARARLKTIAAILDALGVAYASADDTIEIPGQRVGFKVLTGSISGVSGWTAILIIGDEVAKWQDKDTGANPATEVLASLRPTIATQPHARIILSSSPMTESDAHAKAFAQGDTSFQMTARCATWEANPTITEADTHEIEPDERVWRREYLAEPQSELIDGFLSDVVDGCIDRDRSGTSSGLGDAVTKHSLLIATDPASRHDEWALAIVRAEPRHDGAPIVVVEEVRGWRPTRDKPLSVEGTVREIARTARQLRVNHIVGDQHHADSLRALFQRHGITYQGIPWTAPSKLARFTTLRALMSDQRLRLPNEPKTIGQIRSIGVRLLPSGVETIEARGSDDRAFALCLAVTEAIKYAPVGSEADRPAQASVRRSPPQNSGFGMTLSEHLTYGTDRRDDWGNGVFGF